MTASTWSPTDADYQAALVRARAALDPARPGGPQVGRDAAPVRGHVLASWRRCLIAAREAPEAPVTGEDLRRAREAHPFHAALPLLRSRLIDPAVESGLVVALGDARGRLLWVEGRGGAGAAAEAMGFAAGADWSEEVMGTSAPALALRTDEATQVVGAEHFRETVHPWSCSAVPVRDPRTGATIGVLDVTGGADAVAPLVLPLLRSTARAVQEHLATREPVGGPTAPGTPVLRATGVRVPRLICHGRGRPLGGRHAELLVLLLLRPEGSTAAELAEALHGTAAAEGTVRAELLRLRRALADGPVLASRPYRLRGNLDSDLLRVRAALAAGDASAALASYGGLLLPDSEAPAIREERERLRALVRELVLTRGTPRELWNYAQLSEAAEDREVLMTYLQVAPADAAERSLAVVRMETLSERPA